LSQEHHSNIVPWQLICQCTGAILKIIPIKQIIELAHQAGAKVLVDAAQSTPSSSD
jgi:cysteine desulfurase/selenocysteine lyase